jgi:nitroreductase
VYQQGARIAPGTLRGFLAGRRSTRSFEQRPIGREVIEEIVETASFIPSGGNRHAHAFTVISPGETRTRLMAELVRIYRRRSLLMNSVLLRVLARPFVGPVAREFLRDREYGPRMKTLLRRLEDGEDPIFYGAPAAILIHSRAPIPTPKEDCVIAGFTICLAVEAMGLGACFVTLAQNAINASGRCRVTLGLSPHDRVHAVVIVGYPSPDLHRGEPRARAPREVRYA